MCLRLIKGMVGLRFESRVVFSHLEWWELYEMLLILRPKSEVV